MSRAKIWITLAVAAVAIFATPAARADNFALNVDYCGCIPTGTSAGNVSVTNVGNAVTITATLTNGDVFHDQGLASFAFNVVGFSGLQSSDFTINNAGGSTWTFVSPAQTADGAGTFMYNFECAGGANGCNGNPTTFSFTLSKTALTKSAFESTNGGASNVYFAVNVANPSTTGCTGEVGAGGVTGPTGTGRAACSSTTQTPEPTSIAFFGTGLIGLGIVLRKRLTARL